MGCAGRRHRQTAQCLENGVSDLYNHAAVQGALMKKVEPFSPDPRWFEAPCERTPQFFTTFAKVSVALQLALRHLTVQHLSADLQRYKNVHSVYTILAYAASRRFRPLSRTDFTYDVTNATAMATFFRMSPRKLTAALGEVQMQLLAAGETELAKMYDPSLAPRILRLIKKQKRFRKPLRRLLVVEGKLVNGLMGFSALQDKSPKERLRAASLMMKEWRSTVSHLCLGSDFSGLAPQLFEVATEAYLAAINPHPIDAARPFEDDELFDDDTEDPIEISDDLQDLAA
jgi:hypothetical protein